jgi:hypothetical protein
MHLKHCRYKPPPTWYIPYSKIQGLEVGVHGVLRSPFHPTENDALSDELNNLWKLPSDYRLDFDFQSHRLRIKDQTVEPPSDPNSHQVACKIWSDLDTLMSAGGSFDIYDQTGYSQPVVWNLMSQNSPEDVEELLLNLPPTAMSMDEKGFPISDAISFRGPVVDSGHPRWRRWM